MGNIKTIKTSEYVSPGHPDKTADAVVSYLLDRYMEKDAGVRFAMECQIKDNFVTLGGEVTTEAEIGIPQVKEWVREAIEKIGYTAEYADRWGRGNCIDPRELDVTVHVSKQSPDIAQGVDADGWGDQGIFFGMAVPDAGLDYMPYDYAIAKRIGYCLWDGARSGKIDIGLDIKTQVTVTYGWVSEVIVAAPMRDEAQRDVICSYIASAIGEQADIPNIIINGTGAYIRHSSMGDCGTTGRKLAVDFYGSGCRIGGGAPWGKDATKADVTLNVLARRVALEESKIRNIPVYSALSCCIGRKDVQVTLSTKSGETVGTYVTDRPAHEVVKMLGMDKPRYFERCVNGLFVGI